MHRFQAFETWALVASGVEARTPSCTTRHHFSALFGFRDRALSGFRDPLTSHEQVEARFPAGSQGALMSARVRPEEVLAALGRDAPGVSTPPIVPAAGACRVWKP
jgi:hypothetical protein